MNKEMLMMILIGIAILFLVISIVKKAIKIVITIIVIILALTMVDIFAYGTSPIDEINAYKTNIKYGTEITNLTVKVEKSVSNIQSDIKSYSVKNKSAQKLREENKNLHRYQNSLATYKHTKRLDSIHKQYSSYLNSIVQFSDSTVKLSNTANRGIKIKDAQQKNLESLMSKLEGISNGKF